MPIDALTIIFRFTLFGLLIYKVMQLVKTYAIPFLKEELDLERKHQTELLEKEKLLLSTQHRLENQISHQKKTFSLLEKNALLWQTHLLKQKDAIEHTATRISLHIGDKRKVQQKYLALAKDGAVVIPTVCTQVAGELSKNYLGEAGEKHFHTFIASLASTNKLS